jgi:hypothetical protein
MNAKKALSMLSIATLGLVASCGDVSAASSGAYNEGKTTEVADKQAAANAVLNQYEKGFTFTQSVKRLGLNESFSAELDFSDTTGMSLTAKASASASVTLVQDGTSNPVLGAKGTGSFNAEYKTPAVNDAAATDSKVSANATAQAEISDKTYVVGNYAYSSDAGTTKENQNKVLDGFAGFTVNQLVAAQSGVDDAQLDLSKISIPALTLSDDNKEEINKIITDQYAKYFTWKAYTNESGDSIFKLTLNYSGVSEMDFASLVNSTLQPVTKTITVNGVDVPISYTPTKYKTIKFALPDTAKFNVEFVFSNLFMPRYFGVDIDLSGASLTIQKENETAATVYTDKTFKISDNTTVLYGNDVTGIVMSDDDKKKALAGTDYSKQAEE